MVKFKLNKSLDKKMAFQFLRHSVGGVDFSQNVLIFHPELKEINKEDTSAINSYFDNFYNKVEVLLEQKIILYQSEWNKVESNFISETVKLFNGYSFPKGKYIGYISAFNCNPRFLGNKTFQIFYWSDSSIYVTSHELMHFIFYAYTSEKHLELTKGLDTNTGLWWDAAEIFNNVVLSSPGFTKILKTDGDTGYPEHKELVIEATKLFYTKLTTDDFIRKLFSLIKDIRGN